MGGGTGQPLPPISCVPFPSACESGHFDRRFKKHQGVHRHKDIVMFHSVADLLGSTNSSASCWTSPCRLWNDGKRQYHQSNRPMVAVTAYASAPPAPSSQNPCFRSGVRDDRVSANGAADGHGRFIAEGWVAGVSILPPRARR